VPKAALLLVKPPSATGLAQSLIRCSATSDTVFRRPGTGKVPDRCSNHRSLRRSPRSKNGSRSNRPEGPGHSNCKELVQPLGPLLPPSTPPSRLWSISGLCYGSSCTSSCSATLTARLNHQAAHGTPAVGGVTWHRIHC
jgi:hypothetical protein